MQSKEDQALASFRADHNCAQAVLTAFAAEFQFDRNQALGLSAGFGGGMGRMQLTCGAATGAFMALGIYNSQKFPDNNAAKEATYTMVRQFSAAFAEMHGSLDCRSLLNADMNTEEGKRYIRENNLGAKVCEKCVAGAVRIVEKLTGE